MADVRRWAHTLSFGGRGGGGERQREKRVIRGEEEEMNEGTVTVNAV